MAYKDKNKQREAVKQATRRYRQRKKGITKVSQEQGITVKDTVPVVIPIDTEFALVTEQPVTKQSHNPMMVGYVPPQD